MICFYVWQFQMYSGKCNFKLAISLCHFILFSLALLDFFLFLPFLTLIQIALFTLPYTSNFYLKLFFLCIPLRIHTVENGSEKEEKKITLGLFSFATFFVFHVSFRLHSTQKKNTNFPFFFHFDFLLILNFLLFFRNRNQKKK